MCWWAKWEQMKVIFLPSLTPVWAWHSSLAGFNAYKISGGGHCWVKCWQKLKIWQLTLGNTILLFNFVTTISFWWVLKPSAYSVIATKLGRIILTNAQQSNKQQRNKCKQQIHFNFSKLIAWLILANWMALIGFGWLIFFAEHFRLFIHISLRWFWSFWCTRDINSSHLIIRFDACNEWPNN